MSRVLAVRLDSDGDVLLTGPALRALAASADRLDLLVSPAGRAAAELLPAVAEVLVFDAPWSGYAPAPVDAGAVHALVDSLAARRYDRAVIFTSFHQSPLPTALLARLAGIGFVAATSEDYPGSLLDVRHRRPDGLHEVEAALDLAHAAGGALPDGDRGRLAVRGPLPPVDHLVPAAPYVVLHPCASVPARSPEPGHAAAIAAALRAAGWAVLVTGGRGERELA
ncbi:glycosyltransferase family 9 protein, partial [Georgenia yuyongxinii]